MNHFCSKQELVKRFGDAAIKGLAIGAAKKLQESAKLQQQGNASWWKLREAVVLAVGSVAPELSDSQKSFDVGSFTSAILYPDMQTSGK